MGAARLDRWVRKVFPIPVVRGIQLGLAWLLFKSAWTLVRKTPAGWPSSLSLLGQNIAWQWILAGAAILILGIILFLSRDLAALGVILFGIGISLFFVHLPQLSFNFALPRILPLIPTWQQLLQGLWLLAIPQIPLSLGNSIYATADAAGVYFPENGARVTERKLMLTLGSMDAVTSVLGGIPLCHGYGGLTAHYRLGARTGGAPLMLGVIFLALGLFGGSASLQVFRLLPFPVLGVLLAYVGFQHMLLARDLRGWQSWCTALLVLVLAIWTGNLAYGFAAGAVLFYVWVLILRWSKHSSDKD
jgi:SulP family sulfate permease